MKVRIDYQQRNNVKIIGPHDTSDFRLNSPTKEQQQQQQRTMNKNRGGENIQLQRGAI